MLYALYIQNAKSPATIKSLCQAIDKHYLLSVLSPPCKHALVASMSEVSILPGQLVVKRGDPPNEWYVLYEGVCSVRDECGLNVKTLLPGDLFGEYAIIHGTTRSASIVTNTACSLYRISKGHHTRIIAQMDLSCGKSV